MLGRWMKITVLVSAMAAISYAKDAASGDMPAPPAPPLPNVTAIKLMPETLTLTDGRDARRVLVLGVTDSGKMVDLTASAQFRTESKAIEITPDGYIHPKEKATAEVNILAGNLQ